MSAYGPHCSAKAPQSELFDICARNHGGNPQSVQANKIAHRAYEVEI
jgi:hypothetical protein